MLNKNVSVIIKNNVREKELLEVLKKFFEDEEILKIYVHDDNSAFVTEFDGMAVTKWYIKDIYELIDCHILNIRYRDYEIVEMI